jgi:hypothetical protein
MGGNESKAKPESRSPPESLNSSVIQEPAASCSSSVDGFVVEEGLEVGNPAVER